MKAWLMKAGAHAALAEPFVRMFGRGRQDPGLDRQIAAMLELERILRLPSLDSMEPAAARRYAEAGLSPLDVTGPAMAQTIDTTAAGVPVRIYVPPRAGPHWLVYLHGGGGVIGSIAACEPITRLIAAQTGCTVASVGYRLGPEHKHPAAIDDSVAAWDAIAARVPRGGKMVVAGDSFGGFLSAQVDRHAKRKPDVQVLIYPITDLELTSPTIDELAEGYLLTRSMVHWFRRHYLNDGDDRRAPSPAHWADLRGSAPAVVATAGFDPLVGEGDAHADRLRRAGVTVRHRRYPSLIHGFLSIAGGVRAARQAVDQLCGDVMELVV